MEIGEEEEDGGSNDFLMRRTEGGCAGMKRGGRVEKVEEDKREMGLMWSLWNGGGNGNGLKQRGAMWRGMRKKTF